MSDNLMRSVNAVGAVQMKGGKLELDTQVLYNAVKAGTVKADSDTQKPASKP
jgi:hypothetical protein